MNAAGQLIGIPSAGILNAQNIGFAIAINTVKPLIELLKLGMPAPAPTSSTTPFLVYHSARRLLACW